MDTLRGSTSGSSVLVGSTRIGLRLIAVVFVLAGLLVGGFQAQRAGAQPALIGGLEIRVHSCPDDLDATGFFQHLTQCTSERGLYGVALGVDSPGTGGPQFEYSQPDDTGRAALMTWTEVAVGNVTITEVAPDPIRPSVAFCSLQPGDGGPLELDGEEVAVTDGVMTIQLGIDDVLMCDWYRFPGGITAGDGGDEGNGDDGGDPGDGGNEGGDGAGAGAVEGVIYSPDGGDGGNPELVGSQIFIQKWVCVDGEQIDGRPEILDTSSADGLAQLEEACDFSDSEFQFALGDVIAAGGDQPAEQAEGAAEGEQVAAGEDEDDGDGEGVEFQGIVADDGTVVDEEGGPDEAVAGGPSGEGGGDAVNQGIVADDEEADDAGADDGEGAVGVYPPLEIGGITEYEGWNGLSAGSYTILESAGADFGQPLVLCDGIFAGAQAGDNIFELTAIDGMVTYDLSEGELLLCSWFNVLDAGNGDGDDDGDKEDEDNHNGNVDAPTNDLDEDGILDSEETDLYSTDPNDADSDDDDVVDGDEILFGTDPNDDDTDDDGYTDGQEMYELGSDPLTDDLLPNDDEDGDFLTNGEEIDEYGTDPRNSDSDGDLVSDYHEVITYGSDPWDEDTDDDGRSDGNEVDSGSDPTVPEE